MILLKSDKPKHLCGLRLLGGRHFGVNHKSCFVPIEFLIADLYELFRIPIRVNQLHAKLFPNRVDKSLQVGLKYSKTLHSRQMLKVKIFSRLRVFLAYIRGKLHIWVFHAHLDCFWNDAIVGFEVQECVEEVIQSLAQFALLRLKFARD